MGVTTSLKTPGFLRETREFTALALGLGFRVLGWR
jgi:hypothetical protein